MIKKLSIGLVSFIMTPLCFAYIFTGIVTEVENSCNLKIQKRKKTEKITLADIECVRNNSLAEKAKEEIIRLASNKKVTVDVKELDKQGRKLSQVTVSGGPDLSYELVRQGYAKFTASSDINHPLMQAQMDAHRQKKGLWGQNLRPVNEKTISQKPVKEETKKEQTPEKKSFFDHSLKEMTTISYDYIKKQVDKFLGFLEKLEKSQTQKKD